MGPKGKDVLAHDYYGRAEFRRDAAWIGLNADHRISPGDLRQRRNHMLDLYHPDHGGSDAMAVQINQTYARMKTWLDKRPGRQDWSTSRKDFRPENGEIGISRSVAAAAKRLRGINVSTVGLIAVLGYTVLTKRK